MSVKFRIGFDITGETLFAMIAKSLPIDNLSVTELPPAEPPANRPEPARLVQTVHHARGKPYQRARAGPNLKKGINGVIMAALQDGPQRTVDLEPKVKAAGYSPNSVTSRLDALRGFGVIEQQDDRKWRLTKKESEHP